MLKEQDRETIEDRTDLLKSIAKSKHKDLKLLTCDILDVEPGVKEFKIIFKISTECYSEAINKFMDIRTKRIEKLVNKIKTRELREGEKIECPEEEKNVKKAKISI